jgi:hypothetical protein
LLYVANRSARIASRAAILVLGSLEIAAQNRERRASQAKIIGAGRDIRIVGLAVNCALPERLSEATARSRGELTRRGTLGRPIRYFGDAEIDRRNNMTWGKGALLWLIGVPLPIIILLALFWR